MVGDDVTVKELLMENREDTKILLSDVSTIKEHLRTLNGRVAKVESAELDNTAHRWKTMGIAAILAILIPIIITLMMR